VGKALQAGLLLLGALAAGCGGEDCSNGDFPGCYTDCFGSCGADPHCDPYQSQQQGMACSLPPGLVCQYFGDNCSCVNGKLDCTASHDMAVPCPTGDNLLLQCTQMCGGGCWQDPVCGYNGLNCFCGQCPHDFSVPIDEGHVD
jgi:hypothetical protein